MKIFFSYVIVTNQRYY